MQEALEEYLKALLRLVEDHRLAELCLEGQDFKIELRTAAALQETPPAPVAPVVYYDPKQSSPAASVKHATDDSEHLYKLRSPLVGVFYQSSSPDSPPFVEEGDYVRAGQVVCLVEAMKVFNEIHADRTGRLVEICSTSGQVVEVDQVLMRFDLSARKPEES